ncbi:hypothetical protein SDC9_195045 [bioreactor metagenome]|uniref:Uncharacterized protein n=1 Tax=bioreactor metagenome TaxID=1076179 RepID=A0A645IJE0_9ZZZZ
MHIFIADHAFFADLIALGLKLGFNQADHRPTGLKQSVRRRQHNRQRNKRNVNADKIDRFGNIGLGEMTHIGALPIDHARILTQTPGQLTITHIKGVNLAGTILQHTVGKSAGGGAEITADTICQPQRKNRQCLLQF